MAERKYIPIAPVGKCKGCGSLFQQVLSRGKARKYCRPECKPVNPPSTKPCDVLGCWKLARSNGAPYCESHYGRIRRTGELGPSEPIVSFLHCLYCGKDAGGKKFCDQRCGTRHRRGVPVFKACICCGHMFEPLNKGIDKKCCSDECERIRKQDISDSRRCVSSMTKDGRSIRYLVFARDNWTCKICNEPVNRKARWPEPDYPTIDHIHPVSRGGSHELDNLQCAHATCNLKKHAKVLNNN